MREPEPALTWMKIFASSQTNSTRPIYCDKLPQFYKNSMSPEKFSERQIIGVHEAGHAVMASLLQVRILDMRIEGTRGYVRDALSGELVENMELKNAAKHVQILMGGEIAVRLLHELHDCEYDECQSMAAGAYGDDAKVEEIAFHFYGEGAPEWSAKLRAITEQTLVENWDCLETLANALTERGDLAGLEAMRIIADAS